MKERNQTDCAFYIHTLESGGAERLYLLLMDEFINRGKTVDLILARREGAFLEQIPDDVNVTSLRVNRFREVPFKLAAYLSRSRPDHLISALPLNNVSVTLANILSGFSTSVYLQEHNQLEKNLEQMKSNSIFFGRFFTSIAGLVYPFSKKVICVSNQIARDYASQCKLPRSRVQVINNPVNVDEIQEKARQKLPASLRNICNQKPYVVGVGNLTKQKDFPTLIRAFYQLRREGNDLNLIIAGEGEERTDLEQLIEELNLKNSVYLPGYVENPYALMNNASLFVLSSIFEGFPFVLLEALSVGVPIVSTDCKSGPAEILKRGKIAPLVPVGDTETLADCMADVLSDPPERKTLQNRARDYSPENIIPQYLNLLNKN